MSTWSLIWLQDSGSSSLEQLMYFHDFTMVIVVMITVSVMVMLFYMMYYNLSDRLFNHNHYIEFVWTIMPIFIMYMIALPSLEVLYLLDETMKPSLIIKSIGHQWYWSYEYTSFDNDIDFESYMVKDLYFDNRLLETDNSLVMPMYISSQIITTSTDVIHSWTIPGLGIKVDCVPGRLNQLIFLINRLGIFFGQCSEICGANHSFMPIKLESVPLNYFMNWTKNFE